MKLLGSKAVSSFTAFEDADIKHARPVDHLNVATENPSAATARLESDTSYRKAEQRRDIIDDESAQTILVDTTSDVIPDTKAPEPAPDIDRIAVNRYLPAAELDQTAADSAYVQHEGMATMLEMEALRSLERLENMQGQSVKVAALENKPAEVQWSVDVGEGSTVAHENHDTPSSLDAVDPVTEDITSSEGDTNDQSQDFTPHEIYAEVSVVSAGLQFTTGSKSINDEMQPVIDRVIDILSGHDDSRITVAVATNESGIPEQDLRLSQERGRAIIARLVNNGIDFARISLDATSDDRISQNSHIVNIQVWAHTDN